MSTMMPLACRLVGTRPARPGRGSARFGPGMDMRSIGQANNVFIFGELRNYINER
jgi:hypothetical protein